MSDAIEGEGGAYVPCDELAATLPADPEGAIVGSSGAFVARGELASPFPDDPTGAITGSGVGFVPGPCECDCTSTVITYGVQDKEINHSGEDDYFDAHNGWRINATYDVNFPFFYGSPGNVWLVHSQAVGLRPLWEWQDTTFPDSAFEQREWLFVGGPCVKRVKIEFDSFVGMSGTGTSPITVDVFADFRSPDFMGPGPGTPAEPVLMDHSSIDDVVPLYNVLAGSWIPINFGNFWISPSAITPAVGSPGRIDFLGYVAGALGTPPTEPWRITVESCAPAP